MSDGPLAALLRATLTRIDAAANQAIDEAKADKSVRFENEAINWARVRVGWTEFFYTSEGARGYRIHVVKASDGCNQLRTHVAARVVQLTGLDPNEVEVSTEW